MDVFGMAMQAILVGGLCAAAQPAGAEGATPYGYEYYAMRRGLDNCRIRFEREHTGRVAFLGGSITYNPGWRTMLVEHLEARFPDTEFDFIHAGIPSMGSTPGAFRLARDVLSAGRIDLLFVEAAVNDQVNGRTPAEHVRGMEGIVRHARIDNPSVDIVMMHFVDPEKIEAINRGETPEPVANHERVAAHYGTPSIDLAREVTERIRAGEFTWDDDFVDLHPSPFGQGVYYRSIVRLLDAAWGEPLAPDAAIAPRPLPPEPLDAKS
ncbi:MAG: SGNH/GDSL hydrolase family protein, partial [Candidatus Hydrogenedentes bacterium]|nr:SGNH/GDSL hydrolase family protein [Candidatus Hydrogenedentota bacterium]